MDARVNKLSPCKVPDQYLKNQKRLLNFYLKKGKNCKFKSVFTNTKNYPVILKYELNI